VSAAGRPPVRILVAVVLTALAVVVLAGNAMFGGADDPPDPPPEETTTTTTAEPTEPVEMEPPTTVPLAPDWYAKGSSRYSARRPPTTTTPEPAADPGGTGSEGYGGQLTGDAEGIGTDGDG
jgi:hypothetical protein